MTLAAQIPEPTMAAFGGLGTPELIMVPSVRVNFATAIF